MRAKVGILAAVVLLSGHLLCTASTVIGLSSFQMGNDWNIQLAQGAKDEMAAYGWQVIHTNAQAITENQIRDLESFLARGVDAVIIGGGMAPSLMPTIQRLIDAGITVVAIDMTVPDALTNIYPDNYMTSELLGVFCINRIGGREGKALHLTIPGAGWHTVTIRDEVASLIFGLENVTEVVMDSGLTDAVSKSMIATRSALLSTPDLDFVYCSWGMPALGAARAIREAGKQEEVFVVCTDADRAVLQEMMKDDSPIAAVIGQLPYVMGQMAVQSLKRAFEGDTTIPKIQFAPFLFITKEPQLVPPGPRVVSPVEAWKTIYPSVPVPME